MEVASVSAAVMVFHSSLEMCWKGEQSQGELNSKNTAEIFFPGQVFYDR